MTEFQIPIEKIIDGEVVTVTTKSIPVVPIPDPQESPNEIDPA